jgi:hypothetical protein
LSTTLVAAVVSLGVSLTTVGVGWWLTANAARQEEDRTARREAYVEMISAASDCGIQGVFDWGNAKAVDTARTIPDFSEALDTPDGRAAVASISVTPAQQLACFQRVQASWARVQLLTDDFRVSQAANKLADTSRDAMSIGLEDDPEVFGATLGKYSDALTDFDLLAHDDVARSVTPLPEWSAPLAYEVAAVGWAAVAITCALWRWRRLRSSDGPPQPGVPVVSGSGGGVDPPGGPAE